MTAQFDPTRIGEFDPANRIVTAPLTRNRAAAGQVPSDLAVEYYRQRANPGADHHRGITDLSRGPALHRYAWHLNYWEGYMKDSLKVAVSCAFGLVAVSAGATDLPFSSAAATYEQNYGPGLWPAMSMLDGDTSSQLNGWAIFRKDNEDQGLDPTLSESALFTLTTPLAASLQVLEFKIYQNYGDSHRLGNFSLGYTTASLPTLSSTDTLVTINNVSSPGVTFGFSAPGQILASGGGPAKAIYTIAGTVDSATPVTAFFLHAISDPNGGLYPTGGPGVFANGNFVVTEFTVAVVPEPETYALMLAGLGVLGFAARRRCPRIRGVSSMPNRG